MRNLLPERNRKILKREYYMRLIVVSLFLIAVVFTVSTASLLPAYFAAHTAYTTSETYTALIEESLARRNARTSADEVRLVNRQLQLFAEDSARVRVSGLFQALLIEKPEGVSITRISFTQEKQGDSISLLGEAETRDALVAFRRALESETRFSSVLLPVSDLAHIRDISFSMSILTALSP